MEGFSLWAHPWWVNLLLLVPAINYAVWRRRPLGLGGAQLVWSGVFAAGFGFVEAAVVVYLRAAIGMLPGYQGTLADVARLSSQAYQQARSLESFPRSLLTVETAREAATIVMLVSVAMLAARALRDRWAAFLWMFAIWDVMYYAGLWATVRWPQSLVTEDVLFLIPVPWTSQVWFPLLVSGLCMAAVVAGRKRLRIED
jgi:hypothetical protein